MSELNNVFCVSRRDTQGNHIEVKKKRKIRLENQNC